MEQKNLSAKKQRSSDRNFLIWLLASILFHILLALIFMVMHINDIHIPKPIMTRQEKETAILMTAPKAPPAIEAKIPNTNVSARNKTFTHAWLTISGETP